MISLFPILFFYEVTCNSSESLPFFYKVFSILARTINYFRTLSILFVTRFNIHTLKSVMLFLLCACLVSACSLWKERLKSEHPAWMEGEWSAVGLQVNIPQTWTMELIVDGKNYEIRYPTLECSGVWTLEGSTQNKAVFTEVVTYGFERCTNGGKIVVTKIDKFHLSFSYFSPKNGKLEAYATLTNSKFQESYKI